MTDSSRQRDAAARRRRTWLSVVVVLVLAVGVVLVVREVRAPADPPAAAATASGTPATVAPTTASPTTASPTTSAPTTSAPPTPAEPAFDRARLSIDDPASPWVVVNKARPLAPIDFAPADLVPIGNGYQLRAEAAQAMDAMIAAAAADGLTLGVQSAYRSYDYQVGLFDAQVRRFGEDRAEVQVARPGHSEHQTGLSADVGGGGCDIESCFATTAEGRWVAARGPEFGYVVRYPDGAQDVTGFKYEPWHVRYVGPELATELQRTGVTTLEEFFGLPAAPGYPG
ncbi:M15 family metallopeptidase [Modestobacter roseus]|uniref:D-alanyl-D-alanine carboxypeptidase n=1 Tax=Modestobacter roseus TaxID=1181884 RepID=A0A562ILN5_9ACTN|nr:M15 family metallopeptidase [Modestobacter roseus]MQA32141.1 D-alanyl-D-alanine carboxypeptidase family protein [Modestobacter roseus]TWH71635.1 D-alanyl-D-alanine carboxypeptidase [Modestobacter roseus]